MLQGRGTPPSLLLSPYKAWDWDLDLSKGFLGYDLDR